MKWSKKNMIWFAAGIILGVSVVLLTSSLFRTKESSKETFYHSSATRMPSSKPEQTATASTSVSSKKAAPTAKPSVTQAESASKLSPTQKATPTPTTVPTYPSWNKNTAYVGGTRIIYKGKVYEAKWWTQSEQPDTATYVWNYIDDASIITPTIATAKKDNTNKKPTPTQAPSSSNEDFKVVAYYPSWKTKQLSKVRFGIVTHVIYAFAIPCSDGTLRPLENPETAKELIKKAHENGAKALIAIGGWSYNDVPLEPTFKEATNSSKKIKKLGDAILELCNTYGFDGVDIDWEHPRVDDSSHTQYEDLIVYLGKKLHADNKILTSAVLSGATPDGTIYYDAAAHSDKVLKTVDFINVMAYDGGDGERHSSYDFAVACGEYWSSARNMPSSKVVLGVPFYGRPSWSSYEDLLKADKNAYKKDTASIYGMEACYNGTSTIKKKTRYAKDYLGGIMVWEITQDTSELKKSLLTAIGEELKK